MAADDLRQAHRKYTNGFNGWKSFFPTEAQSVATVDRLIDRATILRFTGKSFRRPKDIYGAEQHYHED